MKNLLFTVILLINFTIVYSQYETIEPSSKTEVMTLGVFHFSYPNLDVHQTEKGDQINIFSNKAQNEIHYLVKALKSFQPTKIAIEVNSDRQMALDSLYLAYINKMHELKADEVEQVGFRLAKLLGHEKLYCTNDWGKHYKTLSFIYDSKSPKTKALVNHIQNNPDSIYFSEVNKKYSSVLDQLIDLNNPEYIEKRLGAYLTGVFKYEEKKGDFLGVDFETGRWFNRNLRIFRNIQRISHGTNERILVIYGSDHMNLLNIFFKSSPEYELINPTPYLLKAKNSIDCVS